MTSSLPTALVGKRLVVVDVEGNGQVPPEIIELAALPVDDGTSIKAMRHWMVRPSKPITSIVTRKVHGISNDDVADSPAWPEVAGDIEAVLSDRILVAHHATVEHKVIGTHLPSWRPPLVLDTLRLAKHVWPNHARYSLDWLVEHVGFDVAAVADDHYHRARYDTWCAWLLLLRLVEESGLDWAGLVKVAALPASAPLEEPEGGLW
jgi:exodeoxyribonuclease X